MNDFIRSLLAGLCLTGAVWLIVFFFGGERHKPHNRLVRVKQWIVNYDGAQKEKKHFLFISLLTPRAIQRALLLSLLGAGIPLEVEEAMLLWVILGMGFGLAGFFMGGIPWMAAAITAGLLLPVLFVRLRCARRRKQMDAQIPNLLDMLASGLRAGFSLFQGLAHCAEQMPDPIGRTLQQIVTEMTVGFDAESALRRWVERTRSMDLELAVSAILIQREVGGNLAEILDNISAIMRDRREAEMEMKSLTAQGRMEGVIISLLPIVIAVALWTMQPQYMGKLVTTPMGLRLLLAAVGMGMVGILLVQRIARPKY